MNEAEVIAREQARQDRRLLRQLEKILAYGDLRRRVVVNDVLCAVLSRKSQYDLDTLSINGLVESSGPSLATGIPYNHSKLTPKGRETLVRLRAEAIR